MNLACAFGWHQPDGLPRWNDGYYFARCRRCGCDLVRTAYEGWHAPKGYRVVWSAEQPSDRTDVALAPGAAASNRADSSAAPAPTAASAGALPAQPGPRQSMAETANSGRPAAEAARSAPAAEAAEGDEAAADAAPPPQPEAELAPATGVAAPPAETAVQDEKGADEAAVGPRRRLPVDDLFGRLRRDSAAAPVPVPMPEPSPASNWDFMKDDPFDEIVIAPSGTDAAGRTPTPPPTGIKPRPQPAKVKRARWTMAAAFAVLRRRFGTPATWGEPSPAAVIIAALAISGAVAALVMALVPGNAPGGTTAPAQAPIAVEQPLPQAIVPDPRLQADGTRAASALSAPVYVAAGSLACRDAPSLKAHRVRSLARGDAVSLLANAGEWDSLSYRDRQCWALARYLSPVPPAGNATVASPATRRGACPARPRRRHCLDP